MLINNSGTLCRAYLLLTDMYVFYTYYYYSYAVVLMTQSQYQTYFNNVRGHGLEGDQSRTLHVHLLLICYNPWEVLENKQDLLNTHSVTKSLGIMKSNVMFYMHCILEWI